MNVKVYDLKREDRAMVAHLAPESILDRLDKKECGALFAVDEDKPVACGLIIYSLWGNDNSINMEWIHVHESYRGNEVGSALMEEFYELASQLEFDTLRVIFPDEFTNEEARADAVRYFAEWGFVGDGNELMSDIGFYNELKNEPEEDFEDFDPFEKNAPDTYRWLKNEYYGDV